jgi:hypothetical protein
MPHDDLQEPLQALPPMLNDIVREAIRKNFAWQRRNGHTSRFPLEDVTEVLEVAIATAYGGLLKLEGRDIGLYGGRMWH